MRVAQVRRGVEGEDWGMNSTNELAYRVARAKAWREFSAEAKQASATFNAAMLEADRVYAAAQSDVDDAAMIKDLLDAIDELRAGGNKKHKGT